MIHLQKVNTAVVQVPLLCSCCAPDLGVALPPEAGLNSHPPVALAAGPCPLPPVSHDLVVVFKSRVDTRRNGKRAHAVGGRDMGQSRIPPVPSAPCL